MKIFSAKQIRELDRYTIENEPIASSGLRTKFVSGLLDLLIQIIEY